MTSVYWTYVIVWKSGLRTESGNVTLGGLRTRLGNLKSPQIDHVEIYKHETRTTLVAKRPGPRWAEKNTR